MFSKNIVFESRRYTGPTAPPAAVFEDKSRNPATCAITVATWARQPSDIWALSHNGATSLVTVTDAPKLQNIFDGGATVSAWIYPLSDGEGNLGSVASKSAYWDFRVSDELDGFVRLNFRQLFTGYSEWQTANRVIPLASWSMVSVIYSSTLITNDPVLVLNGVAQAITENSLGVGIRQSDVGQNLILGNSNAVNRTFDGLITLETMRKEVLSDTKVFKLFTGEQRWFQ